MEHKNYYVTIPQGALSLQGALVIYSFMHGKEQGQTKGGPAY
jgi:hypothetical protein